MSGGHSGGHSPVWSRVARAVFLRRRPAWIVAPYSVNGDSFAVNQPAAWTSQAIGGQGMFDLMPDGRRAIAIVDNPELVPTAPRQTHVTFLLNFPDELRRRFGR